MYQSRLPPHDVVPQCVHPSFWGTFVYAHILSYRATYLRAVMPTRFDLIIENDQSQHDNACAGGACFHGVSNAVVYCTNASRGLSAIAELLVDYGEIVEAASRMTVIMSLLESHWIQCATQQHV